MYCKACGQPLNDGQAICLNCGVKVGGGTKYCAHCGKEVNPGAAICTSCGMAIKKSVSDVVPDSILSDSWVPEGKSQIASILLCLLLGFLGVHNFYLGETKKGILKLLLSVAAIPLTLLPGLGLIVGAAAIILALIDLIKMIIGKYEVDPNKAF